MLFVLVSLSGQRFSLLLLIFIGGSFSGFAQTHSLAFGPGVTQTVPFGKVGGDAMLPFHKSLTKPGLEGSVLYNYQPLKRVVGFETGLKVYRSAYALRQTLVNAVSSTKTTLRPDYLAISLPVQAVFVFAKSPLDLYRSGQWAMVVGPHLSWIKESGFGLRSQFQGNGRVQTKLTDTFSLNSYWGWGVSAGVHYQHPLPRNRSMNYRLDWTNTFSGIQPWQASLETNGQLQTVEIPHQALTVFSLQAAYGFGIKNSRIRGK